MQALQIITDALMEIGAISQNETPTATDAAFCLRKLNRMFDRWGADRTMAFNVTFSQFNLIANHAPHTIGPTGDFVVNSRPVVIESAQFQLSAGSGSNPAVWTQINVQDDDWWAIQTIPDLTSSVVTDVYYSPDWPNGKLYFWPVPTGTNPVKLEIWGLLGGAYSSGTVNDALTTSIALPPGYWDAVVNNLAVELCPSFDRALRPDLVENARKGYQSISRNNDESPRIQTLDFGMPTGSANGRPDFNFLTGSPWRTQ